MPSLSQCADKGDMRPIQSVVSWLESQNIHFSARTYATLLKGKLKFVLLIFLQHCTFFSFLNAIND